MVTWSLDHALDHGDSEAWDPGGSSYFDKPEMGNLSDWVGFPDGRVGFGLGDHPT